MASNSKKTKMKRLRRDRSSGKARKKEMRKGSTPAFPVHKEQQG